MTYCMCVFIKAFFPKIAVKTFQCAILKNQNYKERLLGINVAFNNLSAYFVTVATSFPHFQDDLGYGSVRKLNTTL